MVHVRRFEKSRVFEKNGLLRFQDLESDGRLVDGSVKHAEGFVLHAEKRMTEVGRLHSVGQGETDFAVYVSSYVGRRVFDSFEDNLNREVAGIISFAVDWAAIEPIFALYKSNSCWTWATNWKWPERENFFRVGDNVSHQPTAIPVQLIC